MNTPIIPLGIGVQAPSYKKMSLHNGTIKALHVMADKCETMGVRGNYSAEVLNDLGIKNISVIGCPSFYRSTSSRVEIKSRQIRAILLSGLLSTSIFWGEYASNWIKALRTQRSLF
ncbi:polysaccharide pyruvyl transferase family protein [Ochrobactrum cytisi]|nr:polysaccharide pyruvyl transferase family protein [Brucella cytisi]